MRINFDYNIDRDRDLLRAVNEVIKTTEVKTKKEAVEAAINSPAKSFFVTPDNASKVLSRLLKGESINDIKGQVREKYYVLFERYKEIIQKEGYSTLPLIELCIIIVYQQAPRFYLSLDTAIKIYDKQRKIEQCRKITKLLR